ncbi:MAG: LamG-like jellyroll fold domain-containing protein [Methylococcales bacterium]
MTQPTSPNQTCSVANGSSTLASANIDDVTVTCTTNQSSSLLGYWIFDDGSGTTAMDSSGNNNDGTVTGAAWVSGYLGGALGFDGVDDYVDLGTLDVPGNQLTIAAWINADTFTHLRLQDARIVSKATGTSSQAHLWMLSTIKSGDNTHLRFRLKTNDTTTTLIGSANSLSTNTWIHVAAVYDGIEMRLYQNGVEVASTSKTGTINQNSGVSAWIGQNPIGNKPFAGLIDDVLIHNQALSATEIMDLANEGSTNNQTPIAIATATPTTGLAPLNVVFNSDSSSDPENETLITEWDFGDHSSVSNAVNPTHTYTTAGTYTATLTVTDTQGLTATDTVSITVNDSVTPTPGLLGYWALDEGTGQTASDSSGNNNEGTINGATWNNGVLKFDGINDYVNLGKLDIPGQALTLAGWVQSDDLENCRFLDCRIISKSTGTSAQAHYWMLSTIKIGNQIRLRFRLKTNGTTSTLIASSGDLTNGELFHAAAVYDGATMRLYKNGVEVGSLAKTGSINTRNTVEAWIGSNPNIPTSRPWKGSIVDVRLYQKALTAAELNIVINNGEVSDSTAPIISNIQATVTDTNATITWETDEAADSVVGYGLDNNYGSNASDPALTTMHSITLTGLTADTEYHYAVSSIDASGNVANGIDQTLTTTTTSDTTPPLINNIQTTVTGTTTSSC